MGSLVLNGASCQIVGNYAKAYAGAGRIGLHAKSRAREIKIASLILRHAVTSHPTLNDGKRSIGEQVFVGRAARRFFAAIKEYFWKNSFIGGARRTDRAENDCSREGGFKHGRSLA